MCGGGGDGGGRREEMSIIVKSHLTQDFGRKPN